MGSARFSSKAKYQISIFESNQRLSVGVFFLIVFNLDVGYKWVKTEMCGVWCVAEPVAGGR